MRFIRFESALPILAVILLLPLAGCASAPPPMEFAREMGPARYGPLPMLWEEGKPRPVRLRVHNKTELPISVWLDNCDGHIRLGDLQPGHFSGLRLPDQLIPFNDQIRVHTFDPDRSVPFASYAVDLKPEWTLRLDIDEDTPELSLVGTRTVEVDLVWLKAVFNWATERQLPGQGKFLMRENPVRGFMISREQNPRRPLATMDRYERTRAVSDEVVMMVGRGRERRRVRSYLSELLDVATGTGRRIGAVRQLRFEDLLLERDPDAYPYGRIYWPSDTDKGGQGWVVPMNAVTRSAVDRILMRFMETGRREGYLFPSPRDPDKPVGYRLTVRSPLHHHYSILPGGFPRPSSPWISPVGEKTRSPRNPSPTTSTKAPGSIPSTPNPFLKTTSNRARTPNSVDPPVPPEARPKTAGKHPPHPGFRPLHRP